MKILDDNILDELARKQGSEPLTIVGVQWVDKLIPADALTPAHLEPGQWILYSDKQLPGIHGKIINIGSIDHQLNVTTINNSSVDITLSDIDNLVKNFYDEHDLHKRKCFIWQYFGDLSLNERFIVFQGLTNSPIVWSEADRSIHFSVLSEVEDKEVGFSPEEAEYDYISEDSVGKAWPLCFGSPLHVPAVKVRQTLTGSLKTKLAIVDPSLFYKLQAIINAYFQQIIIYNYYKSIAGRIQSVVFTMQEAVAQYFTAIRGILGLEPVTPVQKITVAYCYLIGLEDAFKRSLAALELQLSTKKTEYAQKKQGILPWGNRSPKQHRQDIKDLRDQIKQRKKAKIDIIKAKKYVEKAIDYAEWELNVQRTAFQKQTEAFNTICELYGQYIDVLNEICEQRKCETTTILIDGGDTFPQNTTIDLLIKDMRVRGKFNDITFTIDVILPKYRKVPMGDRQTVLNECGLYDYNTTLNKFWIKDQTYSLKGCWCLVRSSDGRRHIIQVEEQVNNRCSFKLIQPNDDTTGSHGTRNPGDIFSTLSPFPLFRGPNVPNASVYAIYNTPKGQIQPLDFASHNVYVDGFISYVNATLKRYNVDPLDVEEYSNFFRLQRMVGADVAQDYIFFQAVRPEQFYTIVGKDIVEIIEVAAVPLKEWYGEDIDIFELPEEVPWEASPGTTVTDFNNPYEIYVANIVPSTVICVMAHRVNEFGETVLDQIPSDYYTLNEAEDLGDLTVTSLKFYTPLKSIQGEQWDDQIYVSLESSIDSNTITQLKYLIETYTEKTWDTDSFDRIEELFSDKYPSNFALFDRKNVLTQLQEIAFQARCVLVLIDEIFYLYYLSEEPEHTKVLTNEDISVGSLSLGYTETENLVTKLTATWHKDYLPDSKEQKIVLRHNIHRYGLHEQQYNFYIYNIRELVMKSATFWLIRWANTWKQVIFKTFLTHLDLDLNDCINLDVTNVNITKAVLQHITYDIENHELTFTCWLPIKAGQSNQYPFAWPSDVEISWPLPEDDAGGDKYLLRQVNGE